MSKKDLPPTLAEQVKEGEEAAQDVMEPPAPPPTMEERMDKVEHRLDKLPGGVVYIRRKKESRHKVRKGLRKAAPYVVVGAAAMAVGAWLLNNTGGTTTT